MEDKQVKTVVLEDDYIKNVIRSGDTPAEDPKQPATGQDEGTENDAER